MAGVALWTSWLRRALIAIGCAGLGSCTSVHWRGSDGAMYHVGLLWYTVEPGAHGTRISCFTPGIDARLAGEDSGLTFGFHTTRWVIPETRQLADPDTIGDEVDAFLHAEFDPVPTSESRWGLFFFKEELTEDATVVLSDSVGVRLAKAPQIGGVSAGYWHANRLVGRALDDGIVHVYRCPEDQPDQVESVLWDLRPNSLNP